MTDQSNGWAEGVNSTGLMITSAALDNHSDADIYDTTVKSTDEQIMKKNEKANKTLKDAMQQTSVKNAIRILEKELFVGTSFVSDGDNMTILEIYIKAEANERELEKIEKNNDVSKMSPAEIIMAKEFSRTDFVTAKQDIKKDDLVIRTNHGRLLKDAGYQADEDAEGYKSSVKRYEITKNALKEEMHPVDVITTLKSLSGIDKIKQNNPIRVKEPEDEDGNQPYYTGSIVLLTSAAVMFAIPVSDTIKSDKKMQLKKNRLVDFILLPKNLNLFENLTKFQKLMFSI